MSYALVCKDKTGVLALRVANRDAHLAHIKSTGVVRMAGPFLDDNGDMCGSLVVLEVDSKADAQAWADADPYALAGLFESVTIQEWKQVVGQ